MFCRVEEHRCHSAMSEISFINKSPVSSHCALCLVLETLATLLTRQMQNLPHPDLLF